jgi:FAD dependent monooxygenase
MTADLGIGANIGIEDVAVLCNILNRELKNDRNRHPSEGEITAMFTEYQQERYARAKAFTEMSGKVTRMHSYDTLFGRIFATYVSPMLYEVQVMKLATAWAKAPKLDYVPVKTIDETAPGWLLAKEDEKISSTPWLLYAGVGVVATGLAIHQYGLSKL